MEARIFATTDACGERSATYSIGLDCGIHVKRKRKEKREELRIAGVLEVWERSIQEETWAGTGKLETGNWDLTREADPEAKPQAEAKGKQSKTRREDNKIKEKPVEIRKKSKNAILHPRRTPQTAPRLPRLLITRTPQPTR